MAREINAGVEKSAGSDVWAPSETSGADCNAGTVEMPLANGCQRETRQSRGFNASTLALQTAARDQRSRLYG
ncbi:MAG TPA: hypothetical protein VHV55_13625 [Pirellulales bacterium]|jgi:hypothetical protein|nr:hypothetical protein [Pirellulales bacterium]